VKRLTSPSIFYAEVTILPARNAALRRTEKQPTRGRKLPIFASVGLWRSVAVACTPASGWEKGQVENQVGLVRQRFFTPRLRVASYDELNAWLLDRCVAYAKAHKHPELTDRTIWQAFETERPQLVQISGPFDGFHATQASVSFATA
jgi:hypothetical protein